MGWIRTRRGTKSPRTWEQEVAGEQGEKRGCTEGGEVPRGQKDDSICPGVLGFIRGGKGR